MNEGEKQTNDEEKYVSTLGSTAFLWGDDLGGPEDDPAEMYHEASKFTPTLHSRQLGPGAPMLESSDVRATTGRSVKRHLGLRSVKLPEAKLPDSSLGKAMVSRTSRREFGRDALSIQDFSTLLFAGHGVAPGRGIPGGGQLRTVPSGGALYPIDIYPAVLNVDGLAPGLYHFDPFREVVEVIREENIAESFGRAFVGPSDISGAAAVFLMAGIFWRTRFKYGLRGYRFTLLEAGHIGQNLLLVAESLGLNAFPIGGFYDRKLDRAVGIDGVNESVIYSVVVGSASDERRSAR